MRWLLAVIFFAPSLGAMAQSSPNLVFNQIPTATQWNGLFSSKADVNNGTLSSPTLNSPAISGGTLNGSDASAAIVKSNGVIQPLSVWVAGTATSGSLITATGSPTARTLGARAADVVNVKDFGAVGNGITDDSPAINAAISHLRTLITNDPFNDVAARLFFPNGAYLVNSTLDFTNLRSPYIEIDGGGSVILGHTSGTPVIDALGIRYLHVYHISIWGNATSTPSIGMQIGRTDTTVNNSADNNSFDSLFIYGSFTFTAFYNLNAETSSFYRVNFWNGYASSSAYGLVQDGLNHFNAQSAFVTEHQPLDTPQSFNDDVFINADIRQTGGGTPIWVGNTSRTEFIDGYQDSSGSNEVAMYSYSSSDANTMLSLDMHSETNAVTDEILVTGPNTTPNISGLSIKDHGSFATNSLLKVDTGITAVTVTDLDVKVASFFTPGAVVFAQPSLWSGSAEVTVPTVGAWNGVEGKMQGLRHLGGTTRFVGDGSLLSLPNPLFAQSVQSAGAVTSVTVTGGGWYTGTTFPAIVIAAPAGANGTNAVATVTAEGLFSVDATYLTNTGLGYSVGQFLTPNGWTCSITPFMRITSVDGSGRITGLSGDTAGACSVITATPTLFGGLGTGAAMNMPGMRIVSIAVSSGGSGYLSTPTVTAPGYIGGTPPILAAVINNNFSVSGANGAIALNASGTNLGVSGPSGFPVINVGAAHDGSAAFIASGSVTGTLAMAANTDGLVLENSGSVSTLTVKLPVLTTISGQTAWISSIGGITTLTMQTSAAGAITGSPTSIAAGGSRRMISDGTTWFPVQ